MLDQTIRLPQAIVDASSLPEAFARMREAQGALDRLAEQATVFHLAELFERNPELISFSFTLSHESNDEGGTDLWASVDIKASPSIDPDELDRLCDETHEWVNSQTTDWKRRMERKLIARPSAAQSQSLAEALMAQLLPPPAFASWQAACLAQAAGPANAPSSPAPSL